MRAEAAAAKGGALDSESILPEIELGESESKPTPPPTTPKAKGKRKEKAKEKEIVKNERKRKVRFEENNEKEERSGPVLRSERVSRKTKKACITKSTL